jgi:hypothetical protein
MKCSRMPLPPVHGFVALLPYFRSKMILDPLALVVSATFVDLESLFYVLIGQPLDHQMWHGYALALTVYPILVALFVISMERLLEGNVRSAYYTLGFKPTRIRYSSLTIYLCCLAGGFSHIFFDMFTHESLPYLLYPLGSGNPFFLGRLSGIMEITATSLAVLTVILWWKNARGTNEITQVKQKTKNTSKRNMIEVKHYDSSD